MMSKPKDQFKEETISTTSTTKRLRKWHEIPLKPTKNKDKKAHKKKNNTANILQNKDINKVNILALQKKEKKGKPTVNWEANRKKKVQRNAAQSAWERGQRVAQIGKKATRRIDKVCEKKEFLSEKRSR